MRPTLIRLALLLGVSLAFSLVTRPRLLYGGALLLGGVAVVRRPSRTLLRALAWTILMPLPGMAVLFLLAGREAMGAWRPGALWGLAHLAPYLLRIGCLMLANLLFLQATPLPELMNALRRLPIPDRAALMVATLIRFLPSALQEVSRVLEAQRCRGLARCRLLTPSGLLALVVPLFLAQIQRSHDLALSLEIRGYASTQPNNRPADQAKENS